MLSLSKNILKQALDLSPVATIIIDSKAQPRNVAYVNQAFEALSGYDADEIVGVDISKLGIDSDPVGTRPPDQVRIACHPRLGVADFMRLDMLPLYDRPGAPQFWVGTEQKTDSGEDHDDVEREALKTVLRDARMHLRRLDGRDSTTGVLNGRAFDDLLQRDWVMARREKRPLAMLAFRLDGFDGYREVYGRHAGDSCLRKVAHAINGSMRRAGDLVGRLSEDQFVVLMGRGDIDQACELATLIAAKVRGLAIHHPRSESDRYVAVSFGFASMVPAAGNSAPELLALAQANLNDLKLLRINDVSAG